MLFQLLLSKIDSLECPEDYSQKFIELSDYFYDKSLSWNIKLFIFQQAASQKFFFTNLLEYLIGSKIFSLNEVKLAQNIGYSEVVFLLNQPDLISLMSVDFEFKNFIAYKCLDYDLYAPLLNLLKELYDSKKYESTSWPTVLKILALIARRHE